MGPRWIKKHRHDKYYRQAQKEGLRSRAGFKLRQIEAKYHLLKNANSILDLCCSPGGWIDEIKLENPTLKIVGVDVVQIDSQEGVKFIQGDLADENLAHKLVKLIPDGVDVVLSDCSPKFTGNKPTDRARQLFLIERILAITSKLLKRGGHFVCKLFDGNYIPKLRAHVKKQFEKTYYFKPDASRKSSSELYLITKYFRKGDLTIQFS